MASAAVRVKMPSRHVFAASKAAASCSANARGGSGRDRGGAIENDHPVGDQDEGGAPVDGGGSGLWNARRESLQRFGLANRARLVVHVVYRGPGHFHMRTDARFGARIGERCEHHRRLSADGKTGAEDDEAARNRPLQSRARGHRLTVRSQGVQQQVYPVST